MRPVPIPDSIELLEHEQKDLLDAPGDWEDGDCASLEIVRSAVQLPSGVIIPTVKVLVFVSAKEQEEMRQNGDTFWLEFAGNTFPPIIMRT